ncbi:hypothetical protein JTB14_019599 [Gonioctena quinquepunctata]|nr:hypothetical protein JTB14_019599 [Gonioctena quinquepunctata]
MARKYLLEADLEKLLLESDNDELERDLQEIDTESTGTESEISEMDVGQPSTSKKKHVKPKRPCPKTTNASKFAKPDSDSENEDSDSEKYIDNFFEWHSKIDFKPIKHKFDSQQSGHSVAGLRDTPSILECFRKFVSTDFLANIVTETNKYYEQTILTNTKPHSRLDRWRPVVENDIFCFFAVSSNDQK